MNIIILAITVISILILIPVIFILTPLMVRKYIIGYGYGWVQVPENHAAVILHEKRPQVILIACSDIIEQTRIRMRLEHCPIPIEFVQNGKLRWFGTPWNGYEIRSWYEFSGDHLRKDIPPQFFLPLHKQVWNYNATTWNSSPNSTREQRKIDFNEEWGVDTADGIQVAPEISVVFQVLDLYKTLFEIDYYPQVIQKIIASAWKAVVQDMEYYRQDNAKDMGDAELKAHNKDLQRAAQKKLQESLGLQSDSQTTEDQLTGLVKEICDNYGILISRVMITDIDPVDLELRKVFQERVKATISAKAQVISAKGDAEADKERAKGERAKIVAQIEGLAEGIETLSNKVGGTDNAIQLLINQFKFDHDGRILITDGNTDGVMLGAKLGAGSQFVNDSQDEEEGDEEDD